MPSLLTPTERILAKLREDLEIEAKATQPPLMGRSEEVGTDLMWCVYEGRGGKDGFKGKEPIAMFKDYDDAAYFIFHSRNVFASRVKALEKAVKAVRSAMMEYEDETQGASECAGKMYGGLTESLTEIAALMEGK